ncbi:MAG: cobyric acid synthase [Candidatus Aramenus sp.]|nr:cobyric acid synthase [Candidatus Aramenus sp.]
MAIIISSPMSDSGKSFVVTALTRALNGVPFKAQNMSLNSYPSDEGGEIAFIQAFQALGAGLRPKNSMNPVLLKPSGNGIEVIAFGRSLGNFRVEEYYKLIPDLWRKVKNTVSGDMVIESAGGLAEPNFMERDISGFLIMKELGVPAILVLDIDRGGAFASAFGVYNILPPSVRGMLRGFIINKFRGEEKFLEEGVMWLENRTGMKYLGFVPYLEESPIMPEDSMNVREVGYGEKKVSVISYPYMSNFNEFYAFMKSNATVKFVTRPSQLEDSDLVILPGTRNTYQSLVWLKERGFVETLRKYPLLGVCGGFQIMGKKLIDPYGLEAGESREYQGLGLLSINVRFEVDKVVSLSEGKGEVEIKGYEIRRGRIEYVNDKPLYVIRKRNGEDVNVEDGALREGKIGTSIHGSLYSGFRKLLEGFGIKIWAKSMEEEIAEMASKATEAFRKGVDIDTIQEIYKS